MFYRLTKEQQQQMLEEVQQFFLQEKDEELSEFAAERVLDFFKESLAPHFYNAAIQDAQSMLKDQFASIEDEVLTLERPIRRQ